ncbi:MAG: hypothetical protein HS124_09045 [Anaerolineales bacterium]|nr:hypothetical protein [Anaerolineales bacterium]MCL4259949.1 hypothetical protein [Anaerolineales bacterium]
MKSKVRIILAVATLSLAALACEAMAGGKDIEAPEMPTVVIPTVEIPTIVIPTVDISAASGRDAEVILSDDFSIETWGTGTDTESSVEYVDNALRFIVYKDNFYVWSTANKETYSNIHAEVTVRDSSSDQNTAFGVMCNLQDNDSTYYFAITPSGLYAIAKSPGTGSDIFLTNDDQWRSSDLIPKNQSAYRIGVDCDGDGALTLYVNGVQIDSVKDTTYTSGRIGLFVWSAEESSSADVSFDDFEMTRLP